MSAARFSKAWALLDSASEGEAENAFRACRKLLQESGATFATILERADKLQPQVDLNALVRENHRLWAMLDKRTERKSRRLAEKAAKAQTWSGEWIDELIFWGGVAIIGTIGGGFYLAWQWVTSWLS